MKWKEAHFPEIDAINIHMGNAYPYQKRKISNLIQLIVRDLLTDLIQNHYSILIILIKNRFFFFKFQS